MKEINVVARAGRTDMVVFDRLGREIHRETHPNLDALLSHYGPSRFVGARPERLELNLAYTRPPAHVAEALDEFCHVHVNVLVGGAHVEADEVRKHADRMTAEIAARRRARLIARMRMPGGRSRFSIFRNPGTFQERRHSVPFDAGDDEPQARASRNLHHLPTKWDDILRERTRSWKAHRQTQWKEC